VVQTWVWFVVGIAYMAIAIAEWYFASRIETINLSEPLEREPVFTNSMEKLTKQRNDAVNRLPELEKRFNEGFILPNELHAAQMSAVGLIRAAEQLNLNNAFTSIENVAEKFDKAANANRVILRIAAASFVVAAIVSFAQGLSII
jgi:hypothetical protein